MSSFFEKLSGTAKSTAQKIGAKSSELATIGKLKMEVMQLSSKIKERKTELGSFIYSSYLEVQEPNKEVVLGFCLEIKGMEDQIGELENQMKAVETQQTQPPEQALQTEQPMEPVPGKVCPGCGNYGNRDASFCGNCGQKL